MKPRLFLNRDVSRIVGITPRQVLHWTEKDLIIPAKEAVNPGDKRGYGYTNLLEFGLCKTLFEMGLGVYAVKSLCRDMRRTGDIKSWTEDYAGYFTELAAEYKELFEFYEEYLQDLRSKLSLKSQGIDAIPSTDEIKEIFKPLEPIGILFCCFKADGSSKKIVFPLTTKYALSTSFVQKEILPSKSVIMVDLGKIKQGIDKEIEALG